MNRLRKWESGSFFRPFARHIAPLCSSKDRKNDLAFPLPRQDPPKSDRLLVGVQAEMRGVGRRWCSLFAGLTDICAHVGKIVTFQIDIYRQIRLSVLF